MGIFRFGNGSNRQTINKGFHLWRYNQNCFVWKRFIEIGILFQIIANYGKFIYFFLFVMTVMGINMCGVVGNFFLFN